LCLLNSLICWRFPNWRSATPKKCCSPRIIFTPGFMVIIQEPRVPCTSTPPTSSFTALQENAHFIFLTARLASSHGMLVMIPAGQLYQLDNTGDEYMILLGARAEAAAKPRFTGNDQVVTVSDYALRHLDKIKAPEEKKARARANS